jgi:hypothetical protein
MQLRLRNKMHPKFAIGAASVVNHLVRISQACATGIDIVVAMKGIVHNLAIGVIDQKSFRVVTNKTDNMTTCRKIAMYDRWVAAN